MAINRRFLYAGLFLVALGGVLVVVDLTALDTGALATALRLWPLALVAIGFGIALRRSRYALLAGIIGAMIPGLVLGGGLAVAPRHQFECGEAAKPAETTTQSGSFTGSATVAVTTNCGSISIDTQPGNTWQLTSSTTPGRAPAVKASEQQLAISDTGHGDWDWANGDRDTWTLQLPSSELGQMGVTVNAGRATLAMPGAKLGRLDLIGNGAEIVVDASAASVANLDATLNFGRLAVQLPPGGEYGGEIRAAAAELELCVPSGLGLHVDLQGSPREVRVNGLKTDASSWENDLYSSATNRANLTVVVNFGSLAIKPIGGCK